MMITGYVIDTIDWGLVQFISPLKMVVIGSH